MGLNTLVEVIVPDFEGEMAQLLVEGADGAERIWIVTQYYNNDLHGFSAVRNEQVAMAERLDPQLGWLMANYPLVESWRFPGIQLNLFDVSD